MENKEIQSLIEYNKEVVELYYKKKQELEAEIPGTEKYEAYSKELSDLLNKINENVSRIEESKNRKEELEAKMRHNLIEMLTKVGFFMISTGISLYGVYRTFKFDEVSTITSTLGRDTLKNTIFPKK